jgi:hypothetical protein
MALKNINLLNNDIDPQTGLTQPAAKSPFSPQKGIRFGGKYGIGETKLDEYASVLSTELDQE